MSTQTKYENLTTMQRHRLVNANEKEFLALKRDHTARLEALYKQLPKCTTHAEHKRTMASIEALLRIPSGPSAA